ncbi:MAG TPA: serine/threonine-protein kinase [Solirubrobacteraceae bacterium]|nr:serine/threonine-protein kinase [Solirubrobacteraceae bacterium]
MRASQLPTNALDDEQTVVNASRAGTRGDSRGQPARGPRTRRITAEAPAEPTLVMDRYRLGKRLGSGAFGTVWSARDERLDRDVAVKVLPRERVIHARFEREARAAARLQHPAIVTLYEAAVDDEGAYLVSELVRGRTLDVLLEQGKLSDREIREIGVSLCDALAHAHSQGVIHRDVKPSNVLVPSRTSGSGDRAKLTDFGVAHVVGGATLTHTGDVVGTLAYMAPEQADGREVGPEADLYSLALVLYEALTGVNPKQGRRQRRDSFVPPLRRQRRELSRRLAAGIDLALRPRPYDRGGLLDLRAALLDSLDEADDTPGVVAPGWRGGEDDDTRAYDEAGPEWREHDYGDAPRLRMSGAGGRFARTGAGPLASTLGGVVGASWLPRAANAAGAGLGAAWLWTHLWHDSQVPPAVVALGAAVIGLVLPLVGSLLTAVALGAVSLAGALPAVVAQVGYGWWQRALFAAAGLAALVAVSRAAHHNLFWLPAQIPPHRTLELAALGVWGAGAALQPFLRVSRFPLLELILCIIWSAALVVGLEAVGVKAPVGELPGALLGTAIVAWQPVLAMIGETRSAAGIR